MIHPYLATVPLAFLLERDDCQGKSDNRDQAGESFEQVAYTPQTCSSDAAAPAAATRVDSSRVCGSKAGHVETEDARAGGCDVDALSERRGDTVVVEREVVAALGQAHGDRRHVGDRADPIAIRTDPDVRPRLRVDDDEDGGGEEGVADGQRAACRAWRAPDRHGPGRSTRSGPPRCRRRRDRSDCRTAGRPDAAGTGAAPQCPRRL